LGAGGRGRPGAGSAGGHRACGDTGGSGSDSDGSSVSSSGDGSGGKGGATSGAGASPVATGAGPFCCPTSSVWNFVFFFDKVAPLPVTPRRAGGVSPLSPSRFRSRHRLRGLPPPARPGRQRFAPPSMALVSFSVGKFFGNSIVTLPVVAHSVPRCKVAMKPTHRIPSRSWPIGVWKTRPLPYVTVQIIGSCSLVPPCDLSS